MAGGADWRPLTLLACYRYEPVNGTECASASPNDSISGTFPVVV